MPVGVEIAGAVPSAMTALAAAHAVKPAEAPIMNPLEIISRHYEPGPLQSLLIAHSVLVARKARELGEKLIDREVPVDLEFLTIDDDFTNLSHRITSTLHASGVLPSDSKNPFEFYDDLDSKQSPIFCRVSHVRRLFQS